MFFAPIRKHGGLIVTGLALSAIAAIGWSRYRRRRKRPVVRRSLAGV
jgi:hypothetical protein